jgi:MOB kinase activator 1
MFVPPQSSPAPQPLPPHCTLKQPSSCVTINTYSIPNSPEPAYRCPSSPAARRLRDDFNSSVVDFSSPSSNARTRGQFKPQRANKGTTSYQLRQFAEATLGSGSLRKAVKLPEGEDLNEWLAVNSGHQSIGRLACANQISVVDFYNQINLLYGSITEFCSPQSCPEMKATDE